MKLQNLLKLSALLLCVSCSELSDMQQGGVDPDAPLTLTVSGGTAPQTRAGANLYSASTGFDGGEQVKVYMQKGSATPSALFDVGAPYNDGTLKKSNLTPASGETTLYYPNGATGTVSLYGLYPAASTATHTVAYDQTGDDSYKASDLMYASVPVSWTTLEEKYSLAPNLPFQHQLVKLRVNIVKYEDVWHVQGVMLHNVKRSVGVSGLPDALALGAAASSTDGSGDEILVANAETASTEAEIKQFSYACVFPAQEWKGDEDNPIEFLTVTADGEQSVYQLKKAFTAGKEYTVTINLNSLALGSTVITDDWLDDSDCIVNPTSASGGTLKMSTIPDQTYTGDAITPATAPTVTCVDKTTGTTTTLTEGTDYDLQYFNNTNAGQAIALAVGRTGSDYEGQVGIGSFYIVQRNLAEADIADIADQTYRRSAWEPELTVVSNGKTLVKNVDYTVSYSDNVNVGTATATITAVDGGNFTGTNSKTFTIMPKSLTSAGSDFTITLSATSKDYTGSAQTVAVSSVTDTNDGTTATMTAGSDYTVSGLTSTSADVGTYIVTVTGTGNYTGTKTATWQISRAVATVTKAPTAKTGLKSGTDNALVEAGTASGGTMYYLCSTSEVTPSTTASGWTTSIPTRSDEGTYYVYYYVKGDSNHSDSGVGGPVTVTVASTDPGVALADAERGYIVAANGKAYPVSEKSWVEENSTIVGMVAYKNGSNGTVIRSEYSSTEYFWSGACAYSVAAGNYYVSDLKTTKSMTWKCGTYKLYQQAFTNDANVSDNPESNRSFSLTDINKLLLAAGCSRISTYYNQSTTEYNSTYRWIFGQSSWSTATKTANSGPVVPIFTF